MLWDWVRIFITGTERSARRNHKLWRQKFPWDWLAVLLDWWCHTDRCSTKSAPKTIFWSKVQSKVSLVGPQYCLLHSLTCLPALQWRRSAHPLAQVLREEIGFVLVVTGTVIHTKTTISLCSAVGLLEESVLRDENGFGVGPWATTHFGESASAFSNEVFLFPDAGG